MLSASSYAAFAAAVSPSDLWMSPILFSEVARSRRVWGVSPVVCTKPRAMASASSYAALAAAVSSAESWMAPILSSEMERSRRVWGVSPVVCTRRR